MLVIKSSIKFYIQHTSMHIKFKNLCNASKRMTMHKSNANKQVHELAPPTCVILLSKNFDPSQFLNVAPSLSIFMSKSNFPQYLCTSLSPLSSIVIKGMPLLIQRVALRGRWLTLKYCIFMDTTICVGMTPLV